MTKEEAIRHIRTVFTKDLADEIILALEDNSVLEDIKAQIPNLVRYESADGQDLILAYDMARLIDDYISGKENTDGSN